MGKSRRQRTPRIVTPDYDLSPLHVRLLYNVEVNSTVEFAVYRFFFHFRQGKELTLDTVGVEFANSEDAYLDAFKGAQDIWSEMLAKRQDPRRCAFEVHDVNDALVFRLPFMELLDSCCDNRSEVKGGAALFHEILEVAARAKRAARQFQEELQLVRNHLRESTRLLAADLNETQA